MIIRVAGAVFVLLGSVGLGLYYAAKDGLRLRDLQELKKALGILSSEIDYMRAPLAEACISVAGRVDGGIAAFFREFAEAISGGGGETAYRLWARAAENNRGKLALASADYEVVDGFGKTLGYLNNEMQQNSIAFAMNYIDEQIVSIQNRADKNRRMYRSLGVIGGLLITVVLW